MRVRVCYILYMCTTMQKPSDTVATDSVCLCLFLCLSLPMSVRVCLSCSFSVPLYKSLCVCVTLCGYVYVCVCVYACVCMYVCALSHSFAHSLALSIRVFPLIGVVNAARGQEMDNEEHLQLAQQYFQLVGTVR